MTIPLYEELDPSPADIAMRLCELNNDEYVIAPMEDISIEGLDDIYFRFGIEQIMNFICAELPLEEYDEEEHDARYLYGNLLIMQEAVGDWLCANINSLQIFASTTNRIRVSYLKNGAYKISSLSKVTKSDWSKYISNNLPPSEVKKRKILLAALDALRHERSAEIAYRKNDMAAFAVHFSYMWRSYARLATYPALHDGRALERARSNSGGGRPKADRSALKTLLKKICPDYLNKDIPYHQLWSEIRRELEATEAPRRYGGSQFYFQSESTTESLTAGSIVEIPPKGEEKPLGFSGFYLVVRSLRELR